MTLARRCPMAGTPATEAARPVVTLSGDVVVGEAIEAATHKLRRDGTTAFGCRFRRPASKATTHDQLETIGVDVGSVTWPLSRVGNQRPPPRAKPL
jgi:hypothetical protein